MQQVVIGIMSRVLKGIFKMSGYTSTQCAQGGKKLIFKFLILNLQRLFFSCISLIVQGAKNQTSKYPCTLEIQHFKVASFTKLN